VAEPMLSKSEWAALRFALVPLGPEGRHLDARLAALEAELAAARRRLGLLEPLASALEDDERHGNLSGRAEGAWDAYQAISTLPPPPRPPDA
jgi:hypothetical protein